MTQRMLGGDFVEVLDMAHVCVYVCVCVWAVCVRVCGSRLARLDFRAWHGSCLGGGGGGWRAEQESSLRSWGLGLGKGRVEGMGGTGEPVYGRLDWVEGWRRDWTGRPSTGSSDARPADDETTRQSSTTGRVAVNLEKSTVTSTTTAVIGQIPIK